jgi:[citrate (pro-3S)-lyase] ligase
VAETGDVLLMENMPDGVSRFLDTLPKLQTGGVTGAAVMNCNPFTLGHRYLIETAAKQCDRLLVFVLSEDKSFFPAEDRIELVRQGCADLTNVTVLPTGPYLISSATFPTYFLKDRERAGQVQCMLDIEIFAGHYAPRFGITRRFVGTEPLSPMTNAYNEALKACLPPRGIELIEVPRMEKSEAPVSASAVRRFLEEGNAEAVRALVPETTYRYLQAKGNVK